MTATKQPAMLWYPSDWLNCYEVRICSLAAQGLWINMIGVMHKGEPYGHLSLKAGVNPTLKGTLNPPVNQTINLEAELASLVGKTTQEVEQLLQELESRNVFSRTPEGVIYCRRMVRDYDKRVMAQKSGKQGGNPHLKGKKTTAQNSESLNPTLNPTLKGTLNLPTEKNLKEEVNHSLDNDNDNVNDNKLTLKGEVQEGNKPTKKKKATPQQNILFKDSEFYDREKFKKAFAPEYQKFDLNYYYQVVETWSAGKGEKRIDWIAVTRGIINRDAKEGKAKLANKFEELKQPEYTNF